MKYCRSRNTLNALAKKCGTISGSHVPFQPSLVKIDVRRDERDLERQDDRGDQDDEQDVLAREAEPREPVGHERGRHDRAERAQDRDRRGVEQQPREVQLRSRPCVKFPNSGAKTQACSSVRQRPCHTIGVWVGSAGSTKVLVVAALLDEHQVARRCRRSGRCRIGYVSPWYVPVGGAGRIDRRTGRRPLARPAGTDVVTMYRSGSRNALRMHHARTT